MVGLQDELLAQKIEVLLDMQAKKIQAEIAKLRDELSQVKEELRKEIHAVKQDPSYSQAGNAHVQMYSDVPPQQEAPPVPRYAQQGYAQQAPPQYAQAPQGYPQQGYPPQQPPQQSWNQAYPPQQRGGDKTPSAAPIDRNGVPPSEVSVEKFFNFSGTGGKKK